MSSEFEISGTQCHRKRNGIRFFLLHAKRRRVRFTRYALSLWLITPPAVLSAIYFFPFVSVGYRTRLPQLPSLGLLRQHNALTHPDQIRVARDWRCLFPRPLSPHHTLGTGDFFSLFILTSPLNDDGQMRLPQELIEAIIDCFSDDYQMLKTCSLVAKSWLARSRLYLFNEIALNKKKARKWYSLFRPDPNGVSRFVRTLRLQQGQAFRWLGTESLDAIPDPFSSFQHVETLIVTWLDLWDFEPLPLPGSLARHFVHFESSLRSLSLPYITARYSTLATFLQLFPKLEDLLIHTPDLLDDNPPLRISRAAPIIHGYLNLNSFTSATSTFLSHLAGLDLRFSSISITSSYFLSGLPLTNLLKTSASYLLHLKLEYVTCCKVHIFTRTTSR